MKIIFMGTPEFAVPALKALLESPEHQVVAVYTQPPRPAGRGQKDRPSPVHLLAETYGIPVYTPVTLRKAEIQEEFAALEADVAVVAAYGLILPEAILKGCRLGCINIHPSLLPRWRGAAPIQRTIMAGDTTTGVAIMQMDKGLDTGDVLALEMMDIPESMNAGELHDNLAEQGAFLLLKVLDGLQKGEIIPVKQSGEGITYADKIQKDEGRIDWSKPALEIQHVIRGLTPWPGAYFEYKGERLKVLKVKVIALAHQEKPGTILDDQLTVACGDNALRPLIVQRAGKGAMEAVAMLRGYAILKGEELF